MQNLYFSSYKSIFFKTLFFPFLCDINPKTVNKPDKIKPIKAIHLATLLPNLAPELGALKNRGWILVTPCSYRVPTTRLPEWSPLSVAFRYSRRLKATPPLRSQAFSHRISASAIF